MVTVLSTAALWGCPEKLVCGFGTQLNETGECEAFICAVGERINEAGDACVAFDDPCANTVCSGFQFPEGVQQMQPQAVNPTSCVCVPTACNPNYTLEETLCVAELVCDPGFIQEGNTCVPDEVTACWQGEGYESPLCVQELCSDHPTAEDGTDLKSIGKCVDDPPPPPEACTNGCHNGISHPHAFGGGANLACTDCHGGNPAGTSRPEAHIGLPLEWRGNAQSDTRPGITYYWNYLTLTGVERFEGGLEYLRFRNPSDLRVADMTCGKESGCHQDRVENVRRSVMSTAVGLVGVAQARDGIPRAVVRDGDGVYQWDTTYGMTPSGGPLTAVKYDSEFTGSVRELRKFEVTARDNVVYNEIDVLREVYDKQCGDCHLGNNGANNRYADFRSSGCASCHMPYALDGRSRSMDPMISKEEPTYPLAYAAIAGFDAADRVNANGTYIGAQRPHPIAHRISLQMSAQRCGSCHVGSNRTDWQYRGFQIDPNVTAQTALDNGFLNADQVGFNFEEVSDLNFGRYHGQAANQVLTFIDWNNDGLDDIPADYHWEKGLQCMDCHTSGEMHNELKFVKVKKVDDWTDTAQVQDMSGALWSHMDQSTEIECQSCHGNLEYRAMGYDLDNRNPVKNLIVCAEANENIPDYTRPAECANLGNGRWLRSKFTGRHHYVAQTKDTVQQNAQGTGTAIRPNGSPVYTLNASIFHGRYDQDLTNGVGPCTNGNPDLCLKDVNDNTTTITTGFSHLGKPGKFGADQGEGGMECYACHSTWQNDCRGCHLSLNDTDGNVILRDYMRSTGEYTYGVIAEADFTYISPVDMQYGINSEGKIAQFLPETKQQVRHLNKDNQEYFGTQVIVNNDADIRYNLYRDRAGYGTRRYQTEAVGLGYPSAGTYAEQFEQMDENAGQGMNQFMPHTTQRSHPLMNCQNCHLDANADNAAFITARWMVNPDGFANISAYLAVLENTDIVRNNSAQTFVVTLANGYEMGNADADPTAFNVDQQTDYCVLAADGFPLCYNNHPAKYAGDSPANPRWNGQYVRAYPTFAQMAGPLNTYLLNKMTNLVRVNNENVQLR